MTEIVLADPELERGIASASLRSMHCTAIARRGGSRSLWESGLAHLATRRDKRRRAASCARAAVVARIGERDAVRNELWDLFDTPAGGSLRLIPDDQPQLERDQTRDD